MPPDWSERSSALNLTRAAATLTGDPTLARASTGTIRRTLISIPTRIARSARRLTLQLPQKWPWEKTWNKCSTVRSGGTLTYWANQPIPAHPRHERPSLNNPTPEIG